MNDRLRVEVFQGSQKLRNDALGDLFVEGPGLVDDLVESASLHELKDNHEVLRLFDEVDNSYDVVVGCLSEESEFISNRFLALGLLGVVDISLNVLDGH